MASRMYSHESPSVLDVRDPYSAFYQGPHHGKHWYLWHPDDIGTAKPMNEVEWFKAFQPLLLRVVNSGYGRQLMGIDADLPTIHKVYKNALHCYLGEGKWWAEFRVGAKWANVIRYRWPEFKRFARFFYDLPNFFTMLNMNGILVPAHATDTFYPDADTESTSVDGWAKGSGSDWPTNHGSAGTGAQDNGPSVGVDISNFDDIYRGLVVHDTSSLGAGSTVTSAFLSLHYDVIENPDSESVDVVSSAPASNTAIVAGDYDSLDTTAHATRITVASLTSGDYEVRNLNATGVAAIGVTGTYKSGHRLSKDTDDTGPEASNTNRAHFSSADEAGVTDDPKLVVTHLLGCS